MGEIHKGDYIKVMEPYEDIIEGPLPWVVEPGGTKDASLPRLESVQKSPIGMLVAGRAGVVRDYKAHPYVKPSFDADGNLDEDKFFADIGKYGLTYEVEFNDGKNPKKAWLGPEYLDVITESEYRGVGADKAKR